MPRFIHTALVALLVLGSTAACSSSDDSGASLDRGGDAAASGDADGDSKSTSTSAQTPRPGGTLRVGVARPATFDPSEAKLTNPADLVVADLLYDTLTDVDADGLAVPGLAEFTANATQDSFTFDLTGATFAGGRAITASDAKTSLERVVAKGARSPAALRLERIAGWSDAIAGRAAEVTGIVAVDDSTLRIDLIEPMAALPALLASPVYGIVALESLAGPQAEADPTPLGSGSFVVSNPEPDALLLERRDRAAKTSGRDDSSDSFGGYVDAVELRLYDTERAAYEAFAAGDVDWAAVPAESAGDAGAQFGAEAFAPFHALLAIGLNTAAPVFADPGLREAVARAIDRDTIVSAVYAQTAAPLDQFVPPAAFGAAEDPCADTCDYAPDEAADIVSVLYPDGGAPTIHLDVELGQQLSLVAEMVADDLEAAGIPVEIRERPFDEYEALVASGEHELFVFAWLAAGSSAEFTLDPLFRSDSPDNITAFAVPQIDLLLAAARNAADPVERARLLADVEAAVASKHAVVPIAQFRSLAVVSETVRDMEIGLDGSFDVDVVWLDGS